jgi:hypothetical protein
LKEGTNVTAIRVGILALVAAFVVTVSLQSSRAYSPQDKTPSLDLQSILEKSGYRYAKVGEGIYEVPASGKNIKEFPLRITIAGDLMIVIAKLADRKSVNVTEALTVKLLELNDSFDIVKFALSKDMLYARIDAHARLVDVAELKSLVETMAGVVDEAYPQIKTNIVDAK